MARFQNHGGSATNTTQNAIQKFRPLAMVKLETNTTKEGNTTHPDE
jgi:hypothetical protein